jgi:phage terminase large subunit-like protein
MSNLLLGLRLGKKPQLIATTTPRPIKIIKEWIANVGKGVVITRGSSHDNADNLAPSFITEIISRYEGTRLGRQELYAEILEDVEGALWAQSRLENPPPKGVRLEVEDIPEQFLRIVVSVDPSWGTKNDECGIIVVGSDIGGMGYVLEDLSGKWEPHVWGEKAADAFDRWKADAVIAETSFGGETVKLVVKSVNQKRSKDGKAPVFFKEVRVNRGKLLRAEPVVGLYEQGRVRHVGAFPGLEEQMTQWVPMGKNEFSPDRVDALVHGLTEVLLKSATGPAKIASSAGKSKGSSGRPSASSRGLGLQRKITDIYRRGRK